MQLCSTITEVEHVKTLLVNRIIINNSVTSFIERQINFVEHAFKIKNTLSPFQIFYFHLSITEISWMDKKVIFSLLAVLSKSIRVRKVKVD